jgi:hypothetical protein
MPPLSAVAELASSTATFASLHEQTCVFTQAYQPLRYYDDGACPRPGLSASRSDMACANGSPGSVAEHSAGSAARLSGRPNLPPLQGLDRRARSGIACLSSQSSSWQRCSPPAPAAAGSSTSFPRGRTARCGQPRKSWPASPVRTTAAHASASPSRDRQSLPLSKAIPRSEPRVPRDTAAAGGTSSRTGRPRAFLFSTTTANLIDRGGI